VYKSSYLLTYLLTDMLRVTGLMREVTQRIFTERSYLTAGLLSADVAGELRDESTVGRAAGTFTRTSLVMYTVTRTLCIVCVIRMCSRFLYDKSALFRV